MRTHYDNLKVSKDAPIEVIQAAYRSLAKKYHPDINKDNPDAARIMKIINSSYEILSDPQKERSMTLGL
jgi:DnaJ-class molecular chaperone